MSEDSVVENRGFPGDAAQAVADKVGADMHADDHVTRALGIRIVQMAPGYVRMTMTVRNDMLNSFRICHGGLITTLADSAFAYACNSVHSSDWPSADHQGEAVRPGGSGVMARGWSTMAPVFGSSVAR